MSNTPKQDALIARMLSNSPRTFDGGYSMTGLDDALIYEALDESNDSITDEALKYKCPIALMSFLASESVKTKEDVQRCRNFIDEYVESTWSLNFGESDNAHLLED